MTSQKNKSCIVIIQYAGDYKETFENLIGGKEETYYCQKYSVDFVSELTKKFDEVITFTLLTNKPYDQLLANGVRAIGGGFNQNNVNKKMNLGLLEKYNPTRIILRTPNPKILTWLNKKKIKTITTFADYFPVTNIKQLIRNYQLKNQLNNHNIDWVANHGVNSCRSLENIGVQKNKIIPWDWPHFTTPKQFSPKVLPHNLDGLDLLFVGSLTEEKGVGDLLEALRILMSENISFRLKLVGGGDVQKFKQLSQTLGIEEFVDFKGLIPNQEIVPLMRQSHMIIVPSRINSLEGFPMTIYEAIIARTPIIASNHPMFVTKLQHLTNAVIFLASQPEELAKSIQLLLNNPQIYADISIASAMTWDKIQIPVEWGKLINCWLSDSHENHEWLSSYTLDSYQY